MKVYYVKTTTYLCMEEEPAEYFMYTLYKNEDEETRVNGLRIIYLENHFSIFNKYLTCLEI